jgi:sortase A
VTASRARPLRAVLRFLGAVLMTSGVLLVADAAITFAWQEPVSALLAQREQSRLADLLEEAERRAAADRRVLANLQAARLLGALADRQERRTRKGDPIGRIELPTADRSWVVVEGTGTGELRKGPGHYPETPLPGERGTVAVAGHRTTYLAPFRTLDRLRRGDRIVAAMPYGRFTYEVERTRIVSPKATWVTKGVGFDRLVLTACHPKYSAKQRIVAFARLADARPIPSRPVGAR